MTKIIAVVNVRGGTGKTTTAVNVAACLAACGRKTLLIDADPQADSTRQLTPTNGDILKCKGLHFLRHDIELEKAIRETLEPGLYILPSSIDLLDFQHQLRVNMEIADRGALLKQRLAACLAERSGQYNFDFVIIDSPPGLEFLTINVMAAATHLLIPILPEYYHMDNLAAMLDTYKIVREKITPGLSILGLLITQYRNTIPNSKDFVNDMRKIHKSLVIKKTIPFDAKLSESAQHHQSIIRYDSKSAGAIRYQAVTKEILQRIGV